jgi:hypothetical protein
VFCGEGSKIKNGAEKGGKNYERENKSERISQMSENRQIA